MSLEDLDTGPRDPLRDIGLRVGICLLLLLCYVLSAFSYAESVAPTGITTVRDYYRRFEPPTSIYRVDHFGETYYHLFGNGAPWYRDFRSSPPVYTFDESRKFIDWCYDPGDSPQFQQDWMVGIGEPVDPTEFRKRFAPDRMPAN